MASFKIEGGRKLQGTIKPQGAKNEALQVICASLLTDEAVTLNNVPDILDINNLINLLVTLGTEATCNGKGTWILQTKQIDREFLYSDEFARQCTALRGSVMLLGALLGRLGEAVISKPGGDKIGRRRLDTHFSGLQKLGAEFIHNDDSLVYRVNGENLQGTYILLDEASVTGTANVVMAAVLAQGRTTIYNAACEPYVQQLCRMLVGMGAKIQGVGSNLLIIDGVTDLHGTTHTILPDMIEIGSFIGMAAMTASELTIKNVAYPHLGCIPDAFSRMGIHLERRGDDIFVAAQDHYIIDSFLDGSIMTFADAPWPGLSPDLLSVMLVVATQAQGSVLIHQKMFESRLFFVDKLIDMGANIILCDPHRAVVIGHDRRIRLRAGKMSSPDIRAGIALLIAALAAKGTSTIDHIEQIDRGYENIEARLKAIGANITRTND